MTLATREGLLLTGDYLIIVTAEIVPNVPGGAKTPAYQRATAVSMKGPLFAHVAKRQLIEALSVVSAMVVQDAGEEGAFTVPINEVAK